MSFVVLTFVEVYMNKIWLWISLCVDDWTAERVIIASNGVVTLHEKETVTGVGNGTGTIGNNKS